MEKNITLENLLEEVLQRTASPEDYYEIAAILESFGWNDDRAAEAFGVEDIFELALLIWDMLQEKAYFQPFVEELKESLLDKVMLIIKSFLRGLIFALPMALSVVSMLTLRFSLWSYYNLTTELATSIAIGTIVSFMSVGGFTQAIARRGFFYLSQGFYNMAKRITFYLIRLGYITCIIVSLAFIVLNTFFQYIPHKMMFVAVIYFLFLSSNWLAITVMYILRREFTFTALISIGILLVYMQFRILKFDIIISQICALLIISILAYVLIIYFFNKDEKKLEKGIAPPMPKKAIMVYSLGPYFAYGFLYFTFIFIDRIIAWSTNSEYMPYIIWFRGDYELGLDFALLMMILPMGFSEVIVTRLMLGLETTQKNSLSHEVNRLNATYLKSYIRSIIFVSISSIISALGIFTTVKLLSSQPSTLLYGTFVLSKVTFFVFITALIAYTILTIALTNAVILFSLSQPNMVTKVLYYSLLIDFISGFLLSRWFDSSFAVFGLLFGAVFFTVSTCRNVVKVLKNLDYYIYAAL